MPEPLRDRVLDQIVATLEGELAKTRPWGGRYPAPPRVTRRWQPVETAAYLPMVIVTVGSGSRPVIVATAGGQSMVEDRFHVALYGYVRGDAATPASRWLLRLQTDVIDALFAGATFGGLARGVEILEDETDDGVLEPLGAFLQRVVIVLDEVKAAA